MIKARFEEVIGQRLEPDRAVLACGVVESDRWYRPSRSLRSAAHAGDAGPNPGDQGPYNTFPYIFGGWIVIGLAWYLVLKVRDPATLRPSPAGSVTATWILPDEPYCGHRHARVDRPGGQRRFRGPGLLRLVRCAAPSRPGALAARAPWAGFLGGDVPRPRSQIRPCGPSAG